ncbi:transmembrane and ubiquitin-like domain-containing protein 1 [Galendromus occidentalis]|uniref:Transmembrane and ubiquitin-like domain-containing protein 1 n=1 Tax=Galendromus occidentalis TaxID=34638 RepID=A0AAJ6W067_9ACAR|nr:transmembrane and ubiquitin-like domain-containing protein 1 [Galendromus occidentalis]
MWAPSSEPVIEGFGDEVVLVLGATFGYVIFTCYQLYRSMSPEIVEDASQSQSTATDSSTTTTVPSPPTIHDQAQPEADKREAEPAPEPEESPEDTCEVPIRLKYLDDVTTTVNCTLSTKIGIFKNRFFSQAFQQGKMVRLICYGKLLSNDQQSLRQSGISAENNIIHVQVSTPPAASPDPTTRETTPAPVSRFEANVASLAYLILGGMLALFWYAHFQYRELFTTSATTALIGISGLFCVFVFSPAPPVYFMNLAERDF